MTKTASLYLKGIAILMMLATHLLFFVQSPNILSIPLPNGSNVSAYIGYACALCVPVFAFINGYGLSKVYEGKSLGQIYLYSIKKMGLFLLEYWIILFSLFVPFYACSVAGAVDWLLILRSLFGWGGGSQSLRLVRLLLSRDTASFTATALPLPKASPLGACDRVFAFADCRLCLGLSR